METIILSIIVIITLVLSYLERRDLVNRLMSKDLTEYKSLSEKPEKNEETPKDETVPLEDAKEWLEEDLNDQG